MAGFFEDIDLPTVEDFGKILDSAKTEEEVQSFLVKHHIIMTSGWEKIVLVPKLRLGSEHVTDFAAFGRASGTTYVTLIELEPANIRPFTKAGQPARRLAGALKQVADWRYWIRNYERYFLDIIRKEIQNRGLSLHGAYPPPFPPPDSDGKSIYYRRKYGYLIVIGRRTLMSDDDLKARASFLDQISDLEIITYDRLVDRLKDMWDLKQGRIHGMRSVFRK
jgi:hypothetical protein